MYRGLYTAAVGMTTQQKKMDVITNNIANAGTTGFKRSVVVTSSFPEELAKRINDPRYEVINRPDNVGNLTMGVTVNRVYSDMSQGAFQKTDDSLNATLNGSGFFTALVPDKDGNLTEKYTRDGSFALSTEGILITKDGYEVQGENGRITLPNGEMIIDDQGQIFVNGERIDRLRIVDFDNASSVMQEYGSNFMDTLEGAVEIPFTGSVAQGYLEGSNSNSVREMVDMITTQRVYDANARVITTHDQIMQRAVSEIAAKK